MENARIAEKCFSNLKDASGEWREFKGKAVDDTMVRLALHMDENPKARTERIMGVCIKKALADLNPELDNVYTFRHKQLDTIVVRAGQGDSAKTLCVMAPDPNVKVAGTHFKWDHDVLDDLQLNKASIVDKAIAYMARPEENTQFRS